MGGRISLTIVYIMDVIFHNYRLIRFNKELEGLSSFEVMLYDDGASWNYLAWSFILIALGLALIYWFWKSRTYIYESKDLLVLLVLALIIFVSFIFTIHAINNPILQSACVVVICIGIGAISIES